MTRVLIIEDHEPTAAAIVAILAQAGFTELDAVTSAAAAEARLRGSTPDSILLDLGLPDRDGVELIPVLRAAPFTGPLLVLTSATHPDRILAALRAGADGYLFKDDLDLRLAASLRALLRGETPLSPGAARAVLDELRAQPAPGLAVPALSQRERAVLELLSTGGSYAEIARELHIQLNTVRSHVRSLYEKCGVQNRAEAINLAWSLGLLRRTSSSS